MKSKPSTKRGRFQWLARNLAFFLILPGTMLAVAFPPHTASAASKVFDTTPFWSPVDAIIGGMGPGTSSTMAETFVAPAGGYVLLNDFSFYAESYYNPNGGQASLHLKAFVYAWSGSLTGQGGAAVGSPLFLGPSFDFSPPSRPNGWTPLTAALGGIGLALTPGDKYVMGITLSDPVDYAASQGDIEFKLVPNRNPNYSELPAGVDGYGGAVWDNNGNDFAALTTSSWDTWGDVGDYAFKADFTVLPEPTPAMLLTFIGSIWATRRWLKRALV